MNLVRFTILLLLSINIHPNILLRAFKKIPEQEITVRIKKWNTAFQWRPSLKSLITFAYCNKTAGFKLERSSKPNYEHNPNVLKNFYKKPYLKNIKNARDIWFNQRIICKKPCPKKIDFDELATLLKNNNFIFYTGAGLSATKVPTLLELEQSLCLDKGITKLIKQIKKDSNQINEAFATFCKKAQNSSPTRAHKSIAKIAQSKPCAIITENLDLLHEKTGIKTIYAISQEIDSITTQDLQEIKIIFCIGLRRDHFGLLGHLKKQNPDIVFIGLNINTPEYLGKKDYLIQDDAQKILPRLAQYF